MIDLLTLDLVEKNLVTDQIVLTVGYDIENLTNPNLKKFYTGEITTDYYGRSVPKSAHGTIRLENKTSSTKVIMEETLKLYNKIVNDKLLIKRINISVNNLITEDSYKKEKNINK